jgi:hypothetical protein
VASCSSFVGQRRSLRLLRRYRRELSDERA